MSSPLVSVVVPTHNRATLLPRLIASLELQHDAPPFEVVVVDDGSTDETWRVLSDLSEKAAVPVSAIRLERNSGPATARNRGWRAAHAPLIAFTDDDCAVDPHWVARMANALEHATVVQGRTVPDQTQPRGSGRFMYTIQVDQEVGYYESCNMGYRRAALEALGGFDESFRYSAGGSNEVGPIFGEDVDLAWRAKRQGFDFAFERDAVVYHEVRYLRFREYLRDMRRREGIPLSIHRNPELRVLCHHHWFWMRSHPRALLAAVGLALIRRRSVLSTAIGVALTFPYIRFRTRYGPIGKRSDWPVTVPLALVADLFEVCVLAAGSVKYRTLVL